jgi:hypothetical protein
MAGKAPAGAGGGLSVWAAGLLGTLGALAATPVSVGVELDGVWLGAGMLGVDAVGVGVGSADWVGWGDGVVVAVGTGAAGESGAEGIDSALVPALLMAVTVKV